MHYAGIDPRKAPDIPGIPSGVELVPLNEVDPRSLYEADLVAQRTKPGDAKITTRPYDDWLAGVWKSPAMVLDLSMAAVYEDRVIGFTLGNGDHTKIWSQMTATMPSTAVAAWPSWSSVPRCTGPPRRGCRPPTPPTTTATPR